MQAMSITTTIKADSVVLPGVSAFYGKKVRITIEEEAPAEAGKLKAFFDLVGKVDIDSGAVEDLRAESVL